MQFSQSANPDPPSLSESISPNRSYILNQLKSGLCAGLTIPPALWLGIWLCARGLSEVMPSESHLPHTTPLGSEFSQSLTQNTTEQVAVYLNHPNNKSFVMSRDEMYAQTSKFRELLLAYSPGLHEWFNSLWEQDRLFIADADQAMRSEHRALYHNNNLNLYGSFFLLPDGQKISVIAHEYIHSQDSIFTTISDRMSPQVVIGFSLGKFVKGGEVTARAISNWLDGFSPPLSAEQQLAINDWFAAAREIEQEQSAQNFTLASMTSSSSIKERTLLPPMPKFKPSTSQQIAEAFRNSANWLEKINQDGLVYQLTYAGDAAEHRAIKSEQQVSNDLNFETLYGDQGHIGESNPLTPPLPGQELFGITALYFLGRKIKKQHQASAKNFKTS